MIAIDVMGGDFAPNVVLKGAAQAAREGNAICLFGPEAESILWLNAHEPNWKSLPISFINTTQVVGMADEPVGAVRKKQDSSLVKAVASLAQGKVSAVVSAGNSGALMVAGVFVLGRQEGIERPAIAGLFPAGDGHVVGLDLGANTDCKPQNLVQFAHLGASYAKRMLGIENPRIALLSNGEEDVKGSLLTKEVFQLLKQESTLNFIGNREPDDVLGGDIDVFVCDGFTGNIFLKTSETIFAQRNSYFKNLLSEQAVAGTITAQALNILEQQLEVTDVLKQMGGALLVGVQKPMFICHGAAQAEDVTQAIRTAARYLKNS
jgi:glycerol-3-phosphate acyltransferase PlsX